MAGTVIPPNLLRKKSRALIDRAWAAGNRKPTGSNGAEHAPEPVSATDPRTEIERKIEEVAVRRKRRRDLRV